MKDVFVLCMQSGCSLLHLAAQLDHHEAVECLLEKKADADAKDKVNNIMNFIVGILCTRIHGPSFVRARYCSVKIGLWTRHVHLCCEVPDILNEFEFCSSRLFR